MIMRGKNTLNSVDICVKFSNKMEFKLETSKFRKSLKWLKSLPSI